MKKENIPVRKKVESFLFLFVMLLLGVVISMQIKVVVKENNRIAELKKKQVDSYKSQLSQLEKDTNTLRSEVANLSENYKYQLVMLSNNNAGFFETVTSLNSSINYVKIVAGLSDVEKPGVEIRLDDANVITGKDYTYFLVHDIFLTEIINELRAAGAQAISVNGERIIAMSEQLCIGPSVRINNKKIFPPYIIKAVGEPETLELKLKESNIYKKIIARNLLFDLTKHEKLIIPRYSDNYLNRITLYEEETN